MSKHAKLPATFALISLFSLCSCARWEYTVDSGEAMVGLAHDDSRRTVRLVIGDEESLPPAVLADWRALVGAIDGLPVPLEELRLDFSADGRSVLACRRTPRDDGQSSADQTTIWLWPEWRSSEDAIEIADFRQAMFMPSNADYVILWDQAENGDALEQRPIGQLLDVRDASRRYNWPDRLTQVRKAILRVAPDGWCGMVTEDGRLFLAELDPKDPDSLNKATELRRPTTVRDILFLHGGAILVIGRASWIVETISLNDGRQLDAIEGAVYERQGIWLRPDGFVAWNVGRNTLRIVTVRPDGKMSVSESRFPYLVPEHYSPSGLYVEGSADFYAPGNWKQVVLRTPKARKEDPLPPLPTRAGWWACYSNDPILGWINWGCE
jgi:hypothetical protein